MRSFERNRTLDDKVHIDDKPVIAAFLYTHGNEWEIAQHIEQMKPKGVLLRNAHPKAAEQRVRFLGEGPQIMSCYPGDPNGNEQQKAAHSNIEWLNRHNPLTVFDIHQSVTEGATYTEVGPYTSKAAVAGGILLDRKKIVVEDGSFYQAIPNGVVIETSVVDIDPETAAKDIVKGLEKLANNPDALHDKYHEVMQDPEVMFYQSIEIPSMVNGAKAPWLEELEEVPSGSAFTEIQLTESHRNLFNIPVDVPLYYSYWQHDNYSIEEPHRLGVSRDGITRRQWFGGVQWQIAPPVPAQNGMVRFEKEKSTLAKNAPGLLKIKG